MHISSTILRSCGLVVILALSIFALTGCPMDDEPEERRAFISFLNTTIAPRKGASLPELTGREERALGEYAGHYALLLSFQDTLSKEVGKHAGELLALAAFDDLEGLSKAANSLKKAAGEAETLQKIVADLRAETDEKKAELSLPEDLAPLYNALYEKVVSRPSAASETMFSSVHASFTAILDLLDFIDTHSRDMEIRGRNINLKNIGLKDSLDAKMAAVRETSLELGKAHREMIRAMRQ